MKFLDWTATILAIYGAWILVLGLCKFSIRLYNAIEEPERRRRELNSLIELIKDIRKDIDILKATKVDRIEKKNDR